MSDAKAMPATTRGFLVGLHSNLMNRTRKFIARCWIRWYTVKTHSQAWIRRSHLWCSWLVVILLLVALIFCAPYLAPAVKNVSETALQQFLTTMGGALIGATAIGFSIVVFAMQTNVDRMPHGLFRKLSSDLGLLSAFVCTFTVASSIAALSLFVGMTSTALVIMLSAWGAALVLLLLLLSYRRALKLISPYEQLRIVQQSAINDLRKWAVRARRLDPLLRLPEDRDEASSPEVVDSRRLAFFRMNSHWINAATEGLQYAMSFSRSFADRGDHEVAQAALNVVVAINKSYVEVKGRTFISSNGLFDNPLVTDGFINNTLEELRQNVQIGVTRGDERQIEDSFRALAALGQVYLTINYANGGALKSHAQLAAGYLSSAVESVMPHNKPDVLMQGLRYMGTLGQRMILDSESMSIATTSERIVVISTVGIVRADSIPVTTCAVEQLAALSLSLIRSTSGRNHRFALDEVRSDLFSLSMLIVQRMQNSTLISPESATLGPYFSLTSTNSLPAALTDLANALLRTTEDNVDARQIVRNVRDWADRLYDPYRTLLLAAVAQRSHLTFDLVHWVCHVAKVLLCVASSPACTVSVHDDLVQEVDWLVSQLSWIPDDRETINYVETFRLADLLFEVALEADMRECPNVVSTAFDLTMDWAFKAGRYLNGWSSLEATLSCAIVLCGLGLVPRPRLMAAIDNRLANENPPGMESLERAARELADVADDPMRQRSTFDRIDREIGRVDATVLSSMFQEVADKLAAAAIRHPDDVPPLQAGNVN